MDIIPTNLTILPYQFINSVDCPTEVPEQPAANVLTDERFDRLKTQSQTVHLVDCYFDTEARVEGIGIYTTAPPGSLVIIELYSGAHVPSNLLETRNALIQEKIDDDKWHWTEKTDGYLHQDTHSETEHLFTAFGFDKVATGARITIETSTAQQIEIAYIYAGPAFKTDRNISAQYSVGYDPLGQISNGAEGDAFVSHGGKIKRISFVWEMLTEHERQRLLLLSAYLGNERKVIVSVHPGNGEYKEEIDKMWGIIDRPFNAVRRKGTRESYWTADMSMQAPHVRLIGHRF